MLFLLFQAIVNLLLIDKSSNDSSASDRARAVQVSSSASDRATVVKRHVVAVQATGEHNTPLLELPTAYRALSDSKAEAGIVGIVGFIGLCAPLLEPPAAYRALSGPKAAPTPDR
jgi:hypothetical protein